MADPKFTSLTDKKDFWNAKPSDMKVGDVLIGKVVLIEEARNAKASRTATIEKADGTTVGLWLSTVIDGAFKTGVQEGDTVRITYNGKEVSKNGSEYNDYSVDVSRADA
jgi:hypothetical protein